MLTTTEDIYLSSNWCDFWQAISDECEMQNDVHGGSCFCHLRTLAYYATYNLSLLSQHVCGWKKQTKIQPGHCILSAAWCNALSRIGNRLHQWLYSSKEVFIRRETSRLLATHHPRRFSSLTSAAWTEVDYIIRRPISLDLLKLRRCIFCLLLNAFELGGSLHSFSILDLPGLAVKMITNCILNTSHSYKAILVTICTMRPQIKNIKTRM